MIHTTDIQEIFSFYSKHSTYPLIWVSQGILQPSNFEVSRALFRTGFHVIGLCTGGNLKITANLTEYEVNCHTFMSVPPTTPVEIISKSDDFKVRLLLFDPSFLLKQTNNTELIETVGFFDSKGVTAFQLNRKQVKQLIPMFGLIRERYEQPGKYQESILRHLTFSLLYQCAGLYENNTEPDASPSDRGKEIVNSFRQLVKKHCTENRKLEFYAGKLFITPKHLTETLKHETGKTAGALINEAVIMEAKLLLNDKTQTVQRIAGVLNFPDQAVFSKFFKRHSGITPTEWRKGLE